MKVLETERLILRTLEMPDVDAFMGIFSDPVAMRYYPGTKSRREAEDWVRCFQMSYREHGFGLWAAILKDSGEFARHCGLVVQEIGYLFLRKFWGSASMPGLCLRHPLLRPARLPDRPLQPGLPEIGREGRYEARKAHPQVEQVALRLPIEDSID